MHTVKSLSLHHVVVSLSCLVLISTTTDAVGIPSTSPLAVSSNLDIRLHRRQLAPISSPTSTSTSTLNWTGFTGTPPSTMSNTNTTIDFAKFLSTHRPDLTDYTELYKHLHQNPELSTQESETAALITKRLTALSSDLKITTNVGGYGQFAVLENGEGPTVLLRADIDALPLVEKTELEYKSTKKVTVQVDGSDEIRGVMHACGHDFHITSLLAATETLVASRSEWSGTLVFLFQPAEERGAPVGAKAMVDDGLYDPKKHACPIPDFVLGQHVFPLKAGLVATGKGTVMTAADSYKITIYGSGGHGSQPHRCIDPVLIASHIVVRLQTIVSREVPPNELAVVTVGAIQSGHTENVISDLAVLKIDIRSVSEEWRGKILEGVKRIVKAECEAGRTPKEATFEKTREFPLTDNDDAMITKIDESFSAYFGDRHQPDFENALGSEDFSVLARAVNKPYAFWFFGGTKHETWDALEKDGKLDQLPINHSPYFAPVIDPTLQTGADAMVVAALTFLGRRQK